MRTKKHSSRKADEAPTATSVSTKIFSSLSKNDFKAIKFTPRQLEFFKMIKKNDVTLCVGDAGTAKTFVACYAALDLLREGVQTKIILSRPAVESGENLGFLPGTLSEKIAPYMKSFLSNMEKIVSHETLQALIAKKVLQMEPLAYMRGETYDDAVMVLDEAQNSDLRQLMLFVTRMGRNSKVIICGDVTQWDIESRKKDLLTFSDKIAKGVEGCSMFTFERADIVRNPLLIKLTDNYESFKRPE